MFEKSTHVPAISFGSLGKDDKQPIPAKDLELKEMEKRIAKLEKIQKQQAEMIQKLDKRVKDLEYQIDWQNRRHAQQVEAHEKDMAEAYEYMGGGR